MILLSRNKRCSLLRVDRLRLDRLRQALHRSRPCGKVTVPHSNKASTSAANERTVVATETPAQSGRPFNPTSRPEPIRVSVALAPKHVGRKENSCKYLQSCKAIR
jgi:hypothetical protein